MESLGIEMARSEVAYSVDQALEIADKLGYPVVLRPAYTMGGEGGGLVYNVEELKTVCARGLQASMVGQVLVEESILGWEELELEVVRDSKNNMITVCFIENIDPVGVHTGDSFCSAPMLTISEEVQKRLQEKSYKIVEAIQVIGGTTCSGLTIRRQTVILSLRLTLVPPAPQPLLLRQQASRLPLYPLCWLQA